MREILFRARWKDTGKVVENFSEEYIIDACNDDVFIVEQFTGLLDKNGKKIFEGDKTDLGIIKYYGGSFIVEKAEIGVYQTLLELSNNEETHCDLEIIGNIHD